MYIGKLSVCVGTAILCLVAANNANASFIVTGSAGPTTGNTTDIGGIMSTTFSLTVAPGGNVNGGGVLVTVLSGNASFNGLATASPWALGPTLGSGEMSIYIPAPNGPATGTFDWFDIGLTRTGAGKIDVLVTTGVLGLSGDCEGTFAPVTFSVIPAPGALALLGIGGLIAKRRRL